MISIDYRTLEKALAKSARKCYKPTEMSECDGGGGGDAGGAASTAGTAVGSGDAAASTSGITSGDALGKCDHSSAGFLGPGCFHVPAKCAVPFHRWEIGNGGSKRKKDKRGRDKKYAYEKGMKVVCDMLHEDDASNLKIPKKLMKDRLKRIARSVKSMREVNIAEKKFEAEGVAKASKMPSKFHKAKEAFLDIGAFLKDICKGDYKASWFTVSLLAIAVIYVLCPIDLIPDVIPVLGQVDDAMVIMWTYEALKDEFLEWRLWRGKQEVQRAVAEALEKGARDGLR